MANNKIQIKRTSVSGRAANSTTLTNPGELALNMTDGIMYSTNGSAVFEVGANNTNARITGSLNVDNDKSINFQTKNTAASARFVQQNDDNFVFYTTNTSYGARPVFNIYANTDAGEFGFGVPVRFNANVTALTANGSLGSTNQVLTSNGSTVYWSSPGAASVNTAAQYTWTNTHTFSANVSFTGNGIGLTTNTGAIYLGGLADANWKIGRNTGSTTKWKYTNNTIDIITANSNLEGMAIGLVSGNSYFETGYLGTFIASNVTIGNSTVNVFANSTTFVGNVAATSITGNLTGNVSATTITGNLTGNVSATTITGNLTGNVSATTITGNLTGNVSATTITGNLTGNVVATTISGNLTGNVSATTVSATDNVTVGANVFMNLTAHVVAGNTTTAPTVTLTGTGLTAGNTSITGAPQVIVANSAGNTTINTTSVVVGSNAVHNLSSFSITGNTTTAPTTTLSGTGLTAGNTSITGAPQIIVANSAGTTTINTNSISTTSITGNLTGNVVATTISGNLTGNVVATTISGNLTGNVVATTISGNLTGNVSAVIVSASANVTVGANVTIDTAKASFGTVSATNAPQVIVANTSGTTTVNSNIITVGGNTVVNLTAHAVLGNTTTAPTSVLTGSSLNIGNTTITGAPQIVLANTLSTTTINTNSVVVGSNAVHNLSSFAILGNTTTAPTMTLTGAGLTVGNTTITGAPQVVIANTSGTTTINSNFISTDSVLATTINATTVNAATLQVGTGFIANTTTLNVNTDVNLTVNNKRLSFTPVAGGSNVYFTLQSDDNFVFYTTNTTGGSKAVFNVYANTNSPNQNSAFRFNVPVDVGNQPFFANSTSGTSGQVLTTNGSATYWSTISGGGGSGTVTSVDGANGIAGGPITSSGTLYVVAANSTIVVNSSGIAVNTSAIPSGGGGGVSLADVRKSVSLRI